MLKRLSYDYIKTEFDKCGYILISKEYINAHQKLEYICPKHKEHGIMTMRYTNLQKGNRCRFCTRENNHPKRIDESILKEYCNKINIQFVKSYMKYNKTHINYICLKHQDKGIQSMSWDSLKVVKIGCPYCLGRNKTTDEFKKQLHEMSPTIIVIGEYINAKTKIKCKCAIDGYEWTVTPNKLLQGRRGCPKCLNYKNEIDIHKILKKYNINYIAQKRFSNCKDKRAMPFDFYLKDYNILCEYDGEGHYKPIRRGKMTDEEAEIEYEKVKRHDAIKTEYCKQHNIPLIRIPYWERKNMECFLLSELSKYININDIKTV